ncbi:MAG: DUF2318 domain-containing protein [Holophagales bacterium]|nr:DUF2318 domain-containing protein [Holophagales bacterium]
MKRFKPVYGASIVVLFLLVVVGANFALTGGFTRGDYTRISPDADGQVKIDVSDLERRQVRFYRFLNYGNQEVKFFVGRDLDGRIHTAFDASETDYKRKRGFRHEGDWMVNNKCDTAVRLAEVSGEGGGCRPVPLKHRLKGDQLILTEAQILTGWRYFR